MTTKTEALPAQQKRLVAYSHPLRAAIFTILTERKASPAQMTRTLKLGRKDLPNVDYHTKQLVALDCAELVEERRNGSLVEKFYKATDRALVETEEWEALLKANPGLAEHFLGRFMQVQLDDYTLAVSRRTVGDDGEFHMSRTRRILDAEGLVEGLEVYERCRREMDEVERRAAERRSETGSDAIHVSACLGLFRVPSPTSES
jgi:phage tail protein X